MHAPLRVLVPAMRRLLRLPRLARGQPLGRPPPRLSPKPSSNRLRLLQLPPRATIATMTHVISPVKHQANAESRRAARQLSVLEAVCAVASATSNDMMMVMDWKMRLARPPMMLARVHLFLCFPSGAPILGLFVPLDPPDPSAPAYLQECTDFGPLLGRDLRDDLLHLLITDLGLRHRSRDV